MRRFASLLSIGLAVSLAAGPAFAQQGGRGRGGQQGLSLLQLPKPLADKLMLTADQTTKLQEINTKLRADSQAAREASAGDRQALMQKTRELSMKAAADSAALLNADQKKNWEAWTAEYMPNAGLGRSAVALLMVSGLTDEQKGKLKTLAAETAQKRRDLNQGGAGNAEGRMKLETDTQTNVKAILAGDQVKQFDAGLAAIPQGRRRQNQN